LEVELLLALILMTGATGIVFWRHGGMQTGSLAVLAMVVVVALLYLSGIFPH
jgi:hypothetical protein